MDSRRKDAYRYLLYYAMLHIRAVAWVTWRNPLYWRRNMQLVRSAGRMADCMHNLAFYAATDFKQFDEARFWHDFEWLCSHHPDAERIRLAFDRRLAESASDKED